MATYWAKITVEFEADSDKEAREKAYKMYETLVAPTSVITSKMELTDEVYDDIS